MPNANNAVATQVSCSSMLPTLLGVLFIGLKLGHVIDWPWIWVLAPFWTPIAATIVAFVVIGLIVVIAAGMRGGRRG